MSFGLRAASGDSRAESGEARIADRSRSATPASEPKTEARRPCDISRMPAGDERTVCEVERVRSRGGQGGQQPVQRSGTVRWSRRFVFQESGKLDKCFPKSLAVLQNCAGVLGRSSQVERQISSKALCTGSIPVSASISILESVHSRPSPPAFGLCFSAGWAANVEVHDLSSRRAFAITTKVAPVSARIASHRLVWPVNASTRKMAFTPSAKAMFA